MSNQPEIEVKRRRKAEKPRERAKAPVRRGIGGGGEGPQMPSGSGGLSIPRTGKMGGCGGVLVIILIIAYILLSGGGDGEVQTASPLNERPTEKHSQVADLPTKTPRPTREPVAGQSGQKWLVMLYQDADDQVLEQDIYFDFNEAEQVGSSERVTIVAQLDRYRGAFQGDGDWTSVRRYLVTQDDNLNRINSQLLDDLGEVNMADGGTLINFVTWAIQNYPADRYVLLLSDHGMGWPGGWSDPVPASTDTNPAPLASALDGDFLFLSEIDRALSAIQEQTGVNKLDIIGLDACLMSQLEVYVTLQPYAHIALASEEVEPSLGWAYAAFLQELVNNPNMSSQQLATEVVNTYVEQDLRIMDNQARQEFLRQSSPLGSFFGTSSVSANQLARQIEHNGTLTALNMDILPDLLEEFNNFAYMLQYEDQSIIAAARDYSQSYTNIFGKQARPSFIDLGHFVQLVARESQKIETTRAADSVLIAINNSMIAEKHGKGKPGSSGIAIYFPNSTMYRSPYTGPQSYNLLAERFVRTSLWDDFLAYHYNDRSYNSNAVEAVAPSESMPSRAPGFGKITLSKAIASSDFLAPGETIKLSASVSGQNIGYIYLFVGLYDTNSNSIFVADKDYLESPDTRELSGVYYPVWPISDSFIVNFIWDGSLYSVSDGKASVLALFSPTVYGPSAEEAVYTMNGIYTFIDSGEQKFAQLLFMDGKLAHIYGYQGAGDAGAPAEITPMDGDTFTIHQEWMDLDAEGNVIRIVDEPGDTLTFRTNESLTWDAVYAPVGEYIVGFLVSDLDGNTSQTFTQITMR